MCDLAQVSDLISDIYDAALDASLWPRTVQRAMRLLDGVSAGAASDSQPPAGRFRCPIDHDRVFGELYVKRYLRTWIEAREADPRAREVMRLLAPHFQRAAAIGRTLARSQSRAAALASVLDRLPAAVIFVDRTGRLVHANASAAQRLAEGDVLAWADGNPRPCSEHAAAHLRAILAEPSHGPAARGSCAFSTTHTARNGERVTLQVLPLSITPRRQALAPCAAAAAILVSRCGSDLAQRIDSAARLYDFTPAESRVVQVLLGGCTIGRVAALLGVAEATVKTHLQHVFDKTGTRRQVDLARLIVDRGEAVGV